MQPGGSASFVGGLDLHSGVVPSFTGTTIIIKQEDFNGVVTTTAKVVGYGSYIGRTVSVDMPLDLPDEGVISELLSKQAKENLMLRVLNAAHEAMSVATRRKEYQEVNN